MSLNLLPQDLCQATLPSPSSSLGSPDLAPQPLPWLWPSYLPSGKLTLLDGSPGSGTTLFALSLAACLSAGTPWPDGTPCEPANILILAPHDSPHDTLLPRLHAAGADLSHIHFLSHVPTTAPSLSSDSHPFSLPRDLPLLETLISTKQIRLLILDPFTAIPGLTRHLLSLVSLAERTGCAILLTRSLRQAPLNPLQPRLPASPILTAARSHLLLAPDPGDERKHLLLTPKHPLCPTPSLLSYEIVTATDGIPTLHWLGERNLAQLSRLCTGPIRSPHRRAILRFLHASPTLCTVKDILSATCYDYEAGRKMLLRMRQAGELVSPSRGLYTLVDHPCLATLSPPNVPAVPNFLNPTTSLNDSATSALSSMLEALHVPSPSIPPVSCFNAPKETMSNVPNPTTPPDLVQVRNNTQPSHVPKVPSPLCSPSVHNRSGSR